MSIQFFYFFYKKNTLLSTVHSSRKAIKFEMTVSILSPINLKLRILLYIRLIAKQEQKNDKTK